MPEELEPLEVLVERILKANTPATEPSNPLERNPDEMWDSYLTRDPALLVPGKIDRQNRNKIRTSKYAGTVKTNPKKKGKN